MFFLFMTTPLWAAPKLDPHLIFPMRNLFSHPRHLKVLKELNVSCTDCHNFSIKSVKPGPLGRPVYEKYLRPSFAICHHCHIEKVSFARPNQCQTCHQSSDILKPKDHFINWRERHGKIAQVDNSRCFQCHAHQSCNQCHLKLDTMNPNVHRPNFRMYHSVEARMSPQSCFVCHRSGSFCTDCHYGKRQW